MQILYAVENSPTIICFTSRVVAYRSQGAELVSFTILFKSNLMLTISYPTVLLDGQSIIIKVYQYLQKKTKNFVQRLKYAFENYIVEQSGEINYQKCLKTSELRLANEKITDLSAPSGDKDTSIPKIDIASIDYHVPGPFAPIDGDVAKFIFEQILNGDMLDLDHWINDECINYYMHHVLEPMATQAQ